MKGAVDRSTAPDSPEGLPRCALPLERLLRRRYAVGAAITAAEATAPPAAARTPAAGPASAARPAAARAWSLRGGEVHGQLAAVEILAVELGDGALGLLGRGHLDEAEPARLPGELVGDHRRGLHRPALREVFPQGFARRRIREAAH